jgi:hypothetical protein
LQRGTEDVKFFENFEFRVTDFEVKFMNYEVRLLNIEVMFGEL